MNKILIIEDDHIIANSIYNHLIKWNFNCAMVEDFKDIINQIENFNPQLILLDITLPYYNGFYWCKKIREYSSIPIIFISSASDNINMVMAMDMGADDFIAKPFDLNVLTAKINALMRRSYDFSRPQNIIQHNQLTLNLNDATLSYNDNQIDLTKNEFKIIQILLENNGQLVKRETIMQALWLSESFIDDNTLTVNINRLRKKLEEIGLDELIKTKKGYGYWIV